MVTTNTSTANAIADWIHSAAKAYVTGQPVRPCDPFVWQNVVLPLAPDFAAEAADRGDQGAVARAIIFSDHVATPVVDLVAKAVEGLAADLLASMDEDDVEDYVAGHVEARLWADAYVENTDGGLSPAVIGADILGRAIAEDPEGGPAFGELHDEARVFLESTIVETAWFASLDDCTMEQAGQSAALSRSGHGTGFLDYFGSEADAPARILAEAARADRTDAILTTKGDILSAMRWATTER